MKHKQQTHNPYAVHWLLFMAVLLCLGMLAMVGGCSTVKGTAGLVRGAAGLVEGFAQDIEDHPPGVRKGHPTGYEEDA